MPNFKWFLFLVLFSPSTYAQSDLYVEDLNADFNQAYQYYYSNKDSCYFYFDRIKQTATEHQDIEYLLEALIRESWAANFHNDLSIIKHNIKQLDSIRRKNKAVIDTSEFKNYYNTAIEYTKGLYDYNLNNYKNALGYFNDIIIAIEENPDYLDDPEILNLYLSTTNFIGKLYLNEGKYKLAKNFYEKNLRTIKKNKDIEIGYSNNIQILLADIYQKEERYKKANASIFKVLGYYINVSKNGNRVITSYERVIDNHLELKQIDSASYYLQEMKEYLPEGHPLSSKYYKESAKISKAKNDYSSAQTSLQKLIAICKAKQTILPDFEMADAYQEMGLLHMHFNHPEKALNQYKLADNYLEANNSSTLNQTTRLQLLKNKIQALNKIDAFKESLLATNDALNILDQLKPSFKNNADKLFLMEEAFPIFESGLEAAFKLYETTKQDSLIDKAFYYSEKSKSVLLLEAILNTKATKFANIPKQIVEKEQLLKAQINHLEKQINQNKNDVLESELFEANNHYRELIATIETNYKSYYDLKYNADVISISELQNTLKPEEALISYFYGSEAMYIISITGNSKSIEKLKIDTSLEKDIIATYEMLNNPQSNLQELNNASFNLYKKLLAPSLEKLSQKNLIIVADGLLNYIPFSSLSVNGKTEYLLESHPISYVNSATLLEQLLEKETVNNEVLAFAPNFETSEFNSLLPLPNNQNEAEDILNYFSGKTFTQDQATLQNFNLESENYGLLHFATHAIINDESPEYSYLAFQPKANENNFLYVSDLYNLNLNANLVTLSACESGLGDLKSGEGFISLARGFYFSGVSSISSTLWKINDGSTLPIMDFFYKNLSEGKTKDLALQQAQLSFIKENNQNALAHPYYWSGFVLSGNTTAIATGNNNIWIWYVFIILAFIILGILMIRKRKSN
ncbi:MAG: CHAT domain-containing protein [Mesonia sp.]